MNEKTKTTQILIPEGCFEGNCFSCFYARKKDIELDGKMLCKGEPGGRNFPEDKKDCSHYLPKVRTWIKIGILTYLIVMVVTLILGI